MIVGIDHIALSSTDFDEHTRFFNALGYEKKFSAKGAENLALKKRLLKRFNSKHDLALLESLGNLSIELLNHGYVGNCKNYMIPIFDGLPKNIAKKKEKVSMGSHVFFRVDSEAFGGPVYFKESGSEFFGFREIIVKVQNASKSVIFWQSLGFELLEISEDVAVLQFSSLIGKPACKVYLHTSKNVEHRHYLDDEGFNCVALISSSIEKDKIKLESKGFSTTELGKIFVNNRVLNIFFVMGYCGELVEIIGIDHCDG